MRQVQRFEASGEALGEATFDQERCRAQQNHNITVYTVGFGAGSNTEVMNQTAICGGGEYYYSSTDELESVFRNISNRILNASFLGKTLETGDEAAVGRLYSE